MHKLIFSLIGALTLGATLPSLAGPDWQAIEKARKAKQEAPAPRYGDAQGAAGLTAQGIKCPPQPPTLVLDHGPRATGTPYQNQVRRERYAEAVKACQSAGK